jgi:nucleotide-binding universal stress UspA family protein
MATTRKGKPDHAHESVLERELFVAGSVAKKPEPLRSILVGVSGSKQSERAARVAARIAAAGSTRVVLAFVREPSVDGTKEAENLRAENFLDDVWRSLGLEESHVRTVVKEGQPGDVLAELAQGDGIDLVVIGSRGGNAVVRTLGGGVAERFISKSDKPILIVR